MQTNISDIETQRRIEDLRQDEGYLRASAACLAAKWSVRDLAERYGLTESQVEEDIRAGFSPFYETRYGTDAVSLERENFRIDSTNWTFKRHSDGRNAVPCLEHPEGGAWEILEGEFAGEQFFTQFAAFRETAKAGKRIPSTEEWNAIIRSINPTINFDGDGQNDESVRETLGLRLAGNRHRSTAAFYNQGALGCFWTCEYSGVHGFQVTVSPSQVFPVSRSYQKNGFSVRCLAD